MCLMALNDPYWNFVGGGRIETRMMPVIERERVWRCAFALTQYRPALDDTELVEQYCAMHADAW